MRSAVITRPRVVDLLDVAQPRPAAGQVLVRLEGCGVCGSDLAVWQGRPWFGYPRSPGAPGHEGWGEVAAVGEGVTGLRVGARVAALSFNAHAEFDLADADRVVALPEALDGWPVPGEALGCAVNIARRCDFQSGQVVAVVGIGFIGALLVQLAARAGASVIAISRRPFALELARRMGAREALSLSGDVVAQVTELTDGRLCDRAVEATGEQEPLNVCGPLTGVRGRMIIAGFHQGEPRQVDLQLWNWRGLDVVNAHERDPEIYVRGMREAIELFAAGDLDPGPLYTHEFPLERLGDAFTLATQRPDGFLKAIVRP